MTKLETHPFENTTVNNLFHKDYQRLLKTLKGARKQDKHTVSIYHPTGPASGSVG